MGEDQGPEGGSDALDAGGGGEDGEASSAVGVGNTVGLDALAVGVGRVAADAVADLVAQSIVAEDSVG